MLSHLPTAYRRLTVKVKRVSLYVLVNCLDVLPAAEIWMNRDVIKLDMVNKKH